MKSGVLLLAHGAPERIEDVPQYLSFVRGGQLAAHPLDSRASRGSLARPESLNGSPTFTAALAEVVKRCW